MNAREAFYERAASPEGEAVRFEHLDPTPVEGACVDPPVERLADYVRAMLGAEARETNEESDRRFDAEGGWEDPDVEDAMLSDFQLDAMAQEVADLEASEEKLEETSEEVKEEEEKAVEENPPPEAADAQ